MLFLDLIRDYYRGNYKHKKVNELHEKNIDNLSYLDEVGNITNKVVIQNTFNIIKVSMEFDETRKVIEVFEKEISFVDPSLIVDKYAFFPLP